MTIDTDRSRAKAPTPPQAAPRRPRTGSYVSSKEIARASVDGRQVTFKVANMDAIRGFVVAMDDYHWKIATPVVNHNGDPDEDMFKVALVHKSAPLVEVDTKPTDIRDGTPSMLVLVAMSERFWLHCNKTYFGRGDTGRDVHNDDSQESGNQA